MRLLRYCALLLALPMIGTALAAPADDEVMPAPLPPASPITDHLALEAGFYWGRVSTYGQFNSGQGVPGTVLNGERDLGLSNQAYQPRIDLLFRLEQRGRLRVDFLDVRRNGLALLDRTIQFGDQTFQLAQTLQSTIDWRQMDITYTYSFLRGERYELGAGLGVHLLEAQAIAQVPGTPQRVDYSEAGPFATVALDGTYLLSSRWSLNARAQYMRLTVNSFTGMFEDFHGDVQYRWRRNLAFGVSYEYSEREVDVSNRDPSGLIRLTFSGPQLFVRVSY
ncbi:MAG: hypothetical protein ACHP9W_06395 [Steroidobacterales bacterium]